MKSYTFILEGTDRNTEITIKESKEVNKYNVLIKNLTSYPVEIADALMNLASKPEKINNIAKRIQKIFGKKIIDII